MKFQKYMAVGILGLTMALGFSGCQSENQKNQDAYRKIGITVWQRAIMIRRSNPFRKP